MELLELVKIAKLDFTNLIIDYDSFVCFYYSFEISPNEFLEYSKQDYSDKSKKGLVNALTNAKRAIDCQVDKILSTFGFEINQLPDYLNEFVKDFRNEDKNLPFKLSILSNLNIAPGNVVSEIRQLRHRVEHEYKSPDKLQTRRAIEIAELFINATENKLIQCHFFEITDAKHKQIAESLYAEEGKISGINFDFETEKKIFEFTYWDWSNNQRYNMSIASDKKEFVALLRMFMSFNSKSAMLESLKYLMTIIGINIPIDHIKIKDLN